MVASRKHLLLVLVLFICQLYSLVAQNKKIDGFVVNSEHQSIGDVEIFQLNGKKLIAKTNQKGLFEIHIPDSVNVLVFKHLLFETVEVDITKSNNIKVVLPDDPNIDIFEMSLDELLSIKVSVASVSTDIELEEAPGIITVITQEEIEKSGARDFVDVLRMVPGFFPEHDISGVFGLGIRGNWANEGKVLVLLDGIEMNEDFYASVSYGHHFPVDLIERVEIIRGPGSAMYGGSAELGVISIITKTATNKHDVFSSLNYGTSVNTTIRKNINLLYGGSHKALNYTLSGHMSDGILSNRDTQDLWGNQYNLGENNNSKKQELYFNGNLKYKGADVRFIVDKHKISYTYPSLNLSNYDTYFNSYFLNTTYKINVNKNFSITPKLQFKTQNPWHTPELINDMGQPDSTYELNLVSKKYTSSIVGNYNYKDFLNIFGGVDLEHIEGKNLSQSIRQVSNNEMEYKNFAVYLQTLLTSQYGNLTIGGRFNHNSIYGNYFVPRLAYTKNWEKMHIKALFGRAVREPRMRNIAIEPDIKPENTRTIEFEVGAKVSKQWQLTANIFNIQLSNAIVYSFMDSIRYGNYGNTQTRGLELAAAFKSKKSMLSLSYSYSHIINNDIDDYKILNDDNDAVIIEDQNLGFPSHKLYGLYSYTFIEKLDVSSSITYLSKRYGITSQHSQTNLYTYSELAPYFILSLNCTYRDLFIKGLNVSLSGYNILNEEYSYVQPYLGGESPVPANKAEFAMKISYTFSK